MRDVVELSHHACIGCSTWGWRSLDKNSIGLELPGGVELCVKLFDVFLDSTFRVPIKGEFQRFLLSDRISIVVKFLFLLWFFFRRFFSFEKWFIENSTRVYPKVKTDLIEILNFFKVTLIKAFIGDQSISYSFRNSFDDGSLLAVFSVINRYDILYPPRRFVDKVFRVHGKIVVVNSWDLVLSIAKNSQMGWFLEPSLLEIRKESFLSISIENTRTENKGIEIWIRLSCRNTEGL